MPKYWQYRQFRQGSIPCADSRLIELPLLGFKPARLLRLMKTIQNPSLLADFIPHPFPCLGVKTIKTIKPSIFCSDEHP